MELKPGLDGVLTIDVPREGRERRGWNRSGPGRIERAKLLNEGITVLAGHGDIGKQYVNVFPLQEVECLRGRFCGQNNRLTIFEVRRHDSATLVVVEVERALGPR